MAPACEFLPILDITIGVALDAGRVNGFAWGVHYVHLDKPVELWINEDGMASAERLYTARLGG